MSDATPNQTADESNVQDGQKFYDRRSLTYSNTFDSGLKRNFIRAVEWLTGKIKIIQRVKKFERLGAPTGQAF